MNWKKFFFAFIAGWIFIFIFGWFFHTVLLKDTYAALPEGFQRSDADFKGHFGWLVAGQLVFAFLGIGTHLIAYAVQPFPGNLMVYWSVGALVEMAIVGAIYKLGAAGTLS
jgi:hypothetical protein